MEHNKFMKVKRLGTPEVAGLLEGGELRYYEKIDGSNGSFRKENGILIASSHNRVLDTSSEGDNRGFCKWVLTNINPNLIPEGIELYGEWLVGHTVQYDNDSYNKFYLYDILDLATGTYLPEETIKNYATLLGLPYLEPLYTGKFQGLEHLKSIAEQKSQLGENQMEGIVIKDYSFKNRYGRQIHAKYVNEHFCEVQKIKPMKEINNFEVEREIVERFATKARFNKMLDKVRELYEGEIIAMDMTLMKYLPKLMIEDILMEESYTLCTEYDIINFKQLKRMIPKHTARLLTNYLNELVASSL